MLQFRYHPGSTIIFYIILSLLSNWLRNVVFGRFFFDYGIVVLVCQMALSLSLLELGRSLRLIEIPSYSLKRGRKILVPSLLYTAISCVSVVFLNDFSTGVFNALLRSVPLATVCLSVVALERRRGKSQRLLIFSVTLVAVGSVLTGWNPFAFDLFSLVSGLVVVALQSSFLVAIDRAACDNQRSIWEILYGCTFNGLLFAIFLDLIFYESQDAFTYVVTSASYEFWFVIILSLIAGVLFTWTTFYCVFQTSATTTSVLNSGISVLSIMATPMLFGIVDSTSSPLNWLGLLIAIFGSVLYTICVDDKREHSDRTLNVALASGSTVN